MHIACCYSNPFRWQTRRELFNDFRRHVESAANVKLYVGELAYGDRPHEVTSPNNPRDIQLRTATELFHKENILNRTIQAFPAGWKYGAWVDADFTFTRHDWALETVHQLQHYEFVQMFSSYSDLGGNTYGQAHLPMRVTPSFAFNYVQSGYQLPEGYGNGGWRKLGIDLGAYYGGGEPGKPRGVGATGGAWAFRNTSLDTVGGLLEACILGHADWFMAFGLVGEEAPDMHIDGYSADYRNAILSWQKNASRIKKNIGYVDCFAVHHFHGSKLRRRYSSRDLILVKNQFAPSLHLKKDFQGIWQLNPDHPALRDAIRAYFIERSENDPNLYEGEKTLV